MSEEIPQEYKEYYKALFEEFLKDHLKSKVIDDLTYEELLENLNDYI